MRDPYRNPQGGIAGRFGCMTVASFRMLFGDHFAAGEDQNALLSTILHRLDGPSLQILLDLRSSEIDTVLMQSEKPGLSVVRSKNRPTPLRRLWPFPWHIRTPTTS